MGWKAWNVLEGRYALCVLFEYAATLGVIDVAYTSARGARDDYRELWGADAYDSLSRYDGLAAVQVNELGAAILRSRRPGRPRPPGAKAGSRVIPGILSRSGGEPACGRKHVPRTGSNGLKGTARQVYWMGKGDLTDPQEAT